MSKIKSFIMTSLIGGVIVVLPMAILVAVFGWVFSFVTNLIQPLTNLLMEKSDLRGVIADLLVLAIILTVCFIIGVVIRTRFGKFIYSTLETHLLKVAPGYNLIKETVLQILGNNKTPFSSVALVQIFGNDTLATAFVTDEHPDGSFTVFIPTGPNPTSGNIYHLEGKYVHPVDVSVEDAMRSIISCGAGSSQLIDKYKSQM
ncbi:MAG: DUF502 domain-containing protein [Candidatus Omnitrophica bacterium]|nr:DUF502 domain-containing protein [Candidatus Omnitrophota bacterium]